MQPKVETFFPVDVFQSSFTVGCSELAKVQEDLYGNKLRMFRKTFSFFVREKMTEVDDKHFKMGAEGWDIVGQCIAS